MTLRFLPIGATALLAIAACSASSSAPTTTRPTSSSPAPATTATASPAASATARASPTAASNGVDPNAPEVVEPGDIPDNQVFVAYQPAGQPFFVKVPEGWAQTGTAAATTFTDHYNSITIEASTASQAPSLDDVRTGGLADVASNPTFTLGDVTAVQRRAGTGALATFEIGSDPDPVTGKRALLAVERYEFFHGSTLVTLTLSGAKGADNVDPWRTVTDSLTWT
jgi:hypothetical protein